MDDRDDDVRAWFPCPFCYVEIELPVFCSHLQECHCFEFKNAVCPICAATLGRDALGHFTLQHAHSVKRTRKSQKSGFWKTPAAMISKDLRELTTFFDTNSLSDHEHEHEHEHEHVPFVDPLILQFLGHLGTESSDKPYIVSSTRATLTTDGASTMPPFSDPIGEQDYREKRERAAFVQELIFSTIF